jgi:hypothetical protein
MSDLGSETGLPRGLERLPDYPKCGSFLDFNTPAQAYLESPEFRSNEFWPRSGLKFLPVRLQNRPFAKWLDSFS